MNEPSSSVHTTTLVRCGYFLNPISRSFSEAMYLGVLIVFSSCTYPLFIFIYKVITILGWLYYLSPPLPSRGRHSVGGSIPWSREHTYSCWSGSLEGTDEERNQSYCSPSGSTSRTPSWSPTCSCLPFSDLWEPWLLPYGVCLRWETTLRKKIPHITKSSQLG